MRTISRFVVTTAAVAGAAALLLTSCGSDSDAPAVSSGVELEGPTWLLDTAALGVSGAESVTSTIKLLAGQAAGTDGCNQFTGTYTIDGEDLTFGPLAGTLRACPPPEDEVATKVRAGLEATKKYAIDGQKLTLSDGSGKALLTYTESTPNIEGAWTAISVLYNDGIRSIVIDTEITANFAADGTVSGSSGCNNYNGGYTVEGATVKIGPLAGTKKLCPEPEGVMEQEAGFLAAMESAVRFEQVADQLQLFNAEGQNVVTFDKA